MTLSLLIGAGAAQARLKYAMAQPLAPGVIGIHWQAIDKALTVRVYRVTESGGTQLGEFDGARKSFVDSGQFKPGEIVRYRLAEISGGKEKSSTPLAASNSSEMIAEGGFEGFPVGEQNPVGFNVTMPEPGRAEIIEGGLAPGKKCLRVTTPNGQIRYRIGRSYFWVRPPTRYTFSFWTTSDSPVKVRGVVNVFTDKFEKSTFAKVTHYLLSPAYECEGWTRLMMTGDLFKDERLLSFEMIPEYSDNSGAPCFDNFSVIDEDIQYLEGINVPKAIETARRGMKTFPKLTPENLSELLKEIEAFQALIKLPGAITVDEFLEQRARFRVSLQRLESINAVFQIAEIK